MTAPGGSAVGGQRGMALTGADIVSAIGGRLLSGADGTPVSGFSIDSRTLRPGDLFFAIRGERFDGHGFVEAALGAGACGAVVSGPIQTPREILGGRLLITAADTIVALQRVARWVRRRSGATVVGITGSAGKTTTKEMTAAFLGLRHEVVRSGGNLNNHIGLPLSLLELRHGAGVAVVEFGMSHAGEIRRLVEIAEPDVRIWTNVAEVHAAFFDSIEAIADAKAEMLERASPGNLLVVNADDPLVMARAGRFAGRIASFSGSGADATVTAIGVEDLGLDGIRATVRTAAGSTPWRIPLLGRGNLMNSLAAVTASLEFGVPIDEMAARAATLTPAPHRGEVLRLEGGVTVVDDAYNSNPRALTAALAVIASDDRHDRRLAFLGEMLELGGEAMAFHEACGRAAAAAGLAVLIAVGGEPARALARGAVAAGMSDESVRVAETSDDAAGLVGRLVQPGDLVLVKGSRGIRTERVVERLRALFG